MTARTGDGSIEGVRFICEHRRSLDSQENVMTDIAQASIEEQDAWLEVLTHAEGLAEAAAAHTVWQWGDQYGGAVMTALHAALKARGLAIAPPVPVRVPIPDQVRLDVYEADHYRCRWCNSAEQLTVDHVVPVRWGGTNDRSNLQTLCHICNSKKGDHLG